MKALGGIDLALSEETDQISWGSLEDDLVSTENIVLAPVKPSARMVNLGPQTSKSHSIAPLAWLDMMKPIFAEANALRCLSTQLAV